MGRTYHTRRDDELARMLVLKGCPFCGSMGTVQMHRLDIQHANYTNHWDTFTILCVSCHGEGPIGETEADAKLKWNERVAKMGDWLATVPPEQYNDHE